MNKNGFIYGSVFMVFMNFFMRIIGFAYDIFLSKLLGAESMGLFQIGLSTLMTFLIITISGIPTALTKIIAEENSKSGPNNVEGIFKLTFIFNFLLAILLSGVLIFFSDFIAVKMLKNKDMILGVYFMVPAIIIFSLSNVLKAYFYGMKNMVTPGLAQIIEHFTRFVGVMAIIYCVKPTNPINGAIIALIGLSIGESFDLLWSIYWKNRLYKRKKIPHNVSSIALFLKLLTMAVPLTVAGSFQVVFRFTNTVLIPSRLMASGYSSSEAISTFGRIMGMAMPLIHLSFIVTAALVLNLIPSLSEQMALKRYKEMKRDINLSIKATILVSLPLTAIYTVFSKPLAVFLYSDIKVAPYIYIMAFGTILMALQNTISGVLLGLNSQVQDTINGIISMVIRIILIYILVGNPQFGINGFFIAFYVSIIVALILDLIVLRSVIKLNINYLDIIGKPLLATIFMIGAILLTTHDLSNLQSSNFIGFISSLLVGIIAYIFILVITKAVPKNFFRRFLKSK
ncbi:polysaccharide biosynthesis C-terminal domain-containing protein [Tissierella pigra]|uniref:Oligosaccharide flippase family protein n=1 Tax=Tissierella pigra TaxID=2607614 RepID=A0A6N7XKR0_9FIRM|nr:polysaccharide biosynthesis C-terminal domain-containing protein [Tissierella pigra]MSU02661.1 oligosaccharide flippase family protein [Tissierella pigra]